MSKDKQINVIEITSKYGEPWKSKETHAIGFWIEQCIGDIHEEVVMPRIANCVNLLAGIENEELPNVLKAYVTYMSLAPNDLERDIHFMQSGDDPRTEEKALEEFPLLALLDNLKHLEE